MITCNACGQQSSDEDFCSECGTKICNISGIIPAILLSCPVCNETRPTGQDRYCGNCGFDFVEMKAYDAPPVEETVVEHTIEEPAQIQIQVQHEPITPEIIPTNSCLKWELKCSVDLSLRRDGDPETPADQRDRIFPILFEDNLIGRRSDSKGIHPEIQIDDTGISRKHAIIKKHTNGVLTIMDLGSSNGTEINGTQITPNIATNLKNGDQIVIGCWTRIFVIGE